MNVLYGARIASRLEKRGRRARWELDGKGAGMGGEMTMVWCGVVWCGVLCCVVLCCVVLCCVMLCWCCCCMLWRCVALRCVWCADSTANILPHPLCRLPVPVINSPARPNAQILHSTPPGHVARSPPDHLTPTLLHCHSTAGHALGNRRS